MTAGATVVAGRPAIVWLTEDGKWLGQHLDTQLGCAFLDEHFAATRIERRQKVFACWCVVHLFGAAGYANQRFDFVIVRSEFLVSEGPILAPAVLRSEEHTSELQSQSNLVCRLLL